jgi:hypothetical protein
MATWLFILHMLAPLSDQWQLSTDEAREAVPEDMRWRGVEKMFAKFEAETP